MKIINNFLPKQEFKDLQTIMYSDEMEWHYRNAQVKPEDKEYFVHCFFNRSMPSSRHFMLMDPIITKLNAAALIQIRANLTMQKEKQYESGWHTDYINSNYGTTAILYMNTNNGYTKLKINGKIKKIPCCAGVLELPGVENGTSDRLAGLGVSIFGCNPRLRNSYKQNNKIPSNTSVTSYNFVAI